jgi:hypothetical protein
METWAAMAAGSGASGFCSNWSASMLEQCRKQRIQLGWMKKEVSARAPALPERLRMADHALDDFIARRRIPGIANLCFMPHF